MNTGFLTPANRTLSSAKAAKQDGFYTQLADIADEVKNLQGPPTRLAD